MSWKPELEELERRKAFAREMGGEERVARAREAGRLTVRERVDALGRQLDRQLGHGQLALSPIRLVVYQHLANVAVGLREGNPFQQDIDRGSVGALLDPTADIVRSAVVRSDGIV